MQFRDKTSRLKLTYFRLLIVCLNRKISSLLSSNFAISVNIMIHDNITCNIGFSCPDISQHIYYLRGDV